MIPKMDDTHFAYLYAIRRRDTCEVKIGITSEPLVRFGTLQSAHGAPLELAFALPCDSRTEAAVLRRFAASRKLGEWFAETPELLAWLDEQSVLARALPPAEARTRPCDGMTKERRCIARGGNRLEMRIAGSEGPTEVWLCSPHRSALVRQLADWAVEWRDVPLLAAGQFSTATNYHRRRIRDVERPR